MAGGNVAIVPRPRNAEPACGGLFKVSCYLQFEQWVPFPLEQVFLFFANPENLPRIMPPTTDTRIEDLRLLPPKKQLSGSQPLAGVGSEIVASFRLSPVLPFRARWVARITEFEWNHHFADDQKKGPLKRFHHRHEFVPENRDGTRGTAVRDLIVYDVGFGVLGRIANQLFVDRQIRQTFAHRQSALAKLLG